MGTDAAVIAGRSARGRSKPRNYAVLVLFGPPSIAPDIELALVISVRVPYFTKWGVIYIFLLRAFSEAGMDVSSPCQLYPTEPLFSTIFQPMC